MNARSGRPAAWLLVLLALVLAGPPTAVAQDDPTPDADDRKSADKDKPADRDEQEKGKDMAGPRGGGGAKADKAGAAAKSTVYLYKSHKKVKVAGGEQTSLVVQDAFTNKRTTLSVPDAAVAAGLEGLDEGTPIEVEAERQKGKWVVNALVKAKIEPGEEQPNGFVYVDTDEVKDRGGNKQVIVTLRKYGREFKVGVPMWKNDDYQDATWEPDPKIDRELRRLESGEVVAALIKAGRQPMLVEIYPYEPPERGKFIQVKDTKVDGAAAAAFELAAADGTTMTITLPGNEQDRGGQKVLVPHPKLWNAVRRLKPDTEIEVLFREYGQTLFLIDFKLLNQPDPKAEKAAKGGRPAGGKMKPGNGDAAPPAAGAGDEAGAPAARKP